MAADAVKQAFQNVATWKRKQGKCIVIKFNEIDIPKDYWLAAENFGSSVSSMVNDLGGRWINLERGINPSAEILQNFVIKKGAVDTAPSIIL
jgi:hypothetical protein